MNYSEKDWRIIQGRMGYEFSTCFKGSELVFKKITEFFENKRACATRYGCEIFVQLRIINEVFELGDVGYKFLAEEDNPLLDDTLEPAESGGLTIKERNLVVNQTRGIFGKSSESEIAMLSVADLFKIFIGSSSSQYKSAMLSVIVNYGLDSSMSHQCAFMALGPPHNVMLFYEPYGVYSKHGKSYKQCFEKLFRIFSNVDSLKHFKYHTYHDYFLDGGQGIQSMMIDQGTESRDKFIAVYNQIKMRLGASSEKWKYETDNYDKTFEGSTLMGKVGPSNPSELEDAAILYQKHSAKICVSIFLVESARLMLLLTQESGDPKAHVKKKLAEWYKTFASNATSHILEDLVAIIITIYPSNHEFIFATFRDTKNSVSDICEKLTSPE